jgi:hypothetical protein
MIAGNFSQSLVSQLEEVSMKSLESHLEVSQLEGQLVVIL